MKSFKRMVVIAPTRSTCVNIHTVLSNGEIPRTLLMELRGDEIFRAVDQLSEGGFGIVAGTGTGKTVALRDICHKVLGDDIRIDVVTREHEATEKTWMSNVLVVTPGVALNWLKDQKIGGEDLIVIDEIHQTSEHLELAMALAKRDGCTFIWMSATIDPARYGAYLNARQVIFCEAFDPERKAEVKMAYQEAESYVESLLPRVKNEGRAVAVFVPTRALAESLARNFSGQGVWTEFYHGGESAEKLRPYLTGEVKKPFMVFMTIAGASSLNILGLDTVVIIDQWYTQVLRSGGVKALEKCHLGNNELLQMGGRVNGRAIGGEIHILSDRQFEFHELRAVAPEFVLGGDLERVALTCAKLGIDARELDLIGGLDHEAYSRIVERFVARQLIVQNGTTTLTPLGRNVEKLPVKPHWGEMLEAAIEARNEDVVNLLVVIASTEQLFKLTRRDWDRYSEVTVRGSDHLTAYNIVASALRLFGYIRQSDGGTEFALKGNFVKGHGENRVKGPFVSWCDENGFLGREIGNVLLSMKSVYRQLGVPLPKPEEFGIVNKESRSYDAFMNLMAKVQSLDFVYDEQNSQVGRVFSSQGGMASASCTLGEIRFWNDRRGILRASMEGTDIPRELIHKYAKKTFVRALGMSSDGEQIVVQYTLTFAGEEVGLITSEHSPSEASEEFREMLPYVFATWLSAQSFISEDNPMKSDLKMVILENLRRQAQALELNARTGEETFKVYSQKEVSEIYAGALSGAQRVSEIRKSEDLLLPSLDWSLVDKVLHEYPDSINLAGREFEVEYRKGYPPRISLPLEFVSGNHWQYLPDEGIRIGSQIVEVFISIGYNNFCNSNIPKFKVEVSNYLNQRQWDSWQDRPEIAIPDPEDLNSQIPFVTVIYGQCVVTGKEIKAFGTVLPNSDPYYPSDPHFKGQWYRDQVEAEKARNLSLEKLEAIQAEAKKSRLDLTSLFGGNLRVETRKRK